MERLNVTILPWRARLDVAHLDLVLRRPVLDRIGDELQAVVAADVLRGTMLAHGCHQHAQLILRTDRALHMRVALSLAHVLVNQGKDAKSCRLPLDLARSPSSIPGCAAVPPDVLAAPFPHVAACTSACCALAALQPSAPVPYTSRSTLSPSRRNSAVMRR